MKASYLIKVLAEAAAEAPTGDITILMSSDPRGNKYSAASKHMHFGAARYCGDEMEVRGQDLIKELEEDGYTEEEIEEEMKNWFPCVILYPRE